jgi:hypothetical protein
MPTTFWQTAKCGKSGAVSKPSAGEPRIRRLNGRNEGAERKPQQEGEAAHPLLTGNDIASAVGGWTANSNAVADG